MLPEYLFHKDLSELLSAHVIPARSKMHRLAQPVHKHDNRCVTSLGLRHMRNKFTVT